MTLYASFLLPHRIGDLTQLTEIDLADKYRHRHDDEKHPEQFPTKHEEHCGCGNELDESEEELRYLVADGGTHGTDILTESAHGVACVQSVTTIPLAVHRLGEDLLLQMIGDLDAVLLLDPAADECDDELTDNDGNHHAYPVVDVACHCACRYVNDVLTVVDEGKGEDDAHHAYRTVLHYAIALAFDAAPQPRYVTPSRYQLSIMN